MSCIIIVNMALIRKENVIEMLFQQYNKFTLQYFGVNVMAFCNIINPIVNYKFNFVIKKIEMNSFNFIDYIPEELLGRIFDFCNHKYYSWYAYKLYGITNYRFVCKKWNDIIKQNYTLCGGCHRAYKNDAIKKHVEIENYMYVCSKWNILLSFCGYRPPYWLPKG